MKPLDRETIEQPPFASLPAGAHVLVVDDSQTSRLKLEIAVRNMGLRTTSAADGAQALALVKQQSFDLVLLDIIMPGLSGFDVLKALKADPETAHVPVVVISATNDDGTSVAGAIGLGADDFLPKDFDPLVLRARVGASVERKRLRDQEMEYLRQVARLSQAAASLEAGDFDPRRLDLGDVAARQDGLGRLARVFVSMAEKVHERERKLRRTISRLDHSYHLSGLALVMLAAALWATVGVASQMVPHDIGVPDEIYGFARTAVAGPALLFFALLAGGVANILPRRGSWRQFLLFGVCCAIFQIGLFRSFSLIGVTVTVFLTVCLPPVIAVAWSVWRSHEKVSKHIFSAMLMAIIGLVAFSSLDTSGGGAPEAMLGLAYSFAASVAFVAMSHAARGLSREHSPLLVAGLGLSLTALILAPVALLISPVSWSALPAALSDWRSGSVLLYLGLVPTALAYVCYCSGIARCHTAVAGLVASMIEPAVAAGLAFLFLREILSPWEVMGCILLFFAMLTLWLDEKPEPDEQEPGAKPQAAG
jgi:drug/metabolite transporter (DMT)-like permease/DNA-binding NarL/FixJ family response regulator